MTIQGTRNDSSRDGSEWLEPPATPTVIPAKAGIQLHGRDRGAPSVVDVDGFRVATARPQQVWTEV